MNQNQSDPDDGPVYEGEIVIDEPCQPVTSALSVQPAFPEPSAQLLNASVTFARGVSRLIEQNWPYFLIGAGVLLVAAGVDDYLKQPPPPPPRTRTRAGRHFRRARR